ncbi:MAG: DUF2062 domain-containing protein [Desulfobulbaceae bacterium]|nr:MAG: DUF2062 domain-containing protein [Desulfobulbaceae bacterium]
MKPQRTFRYYYIKILRLQGDPHSLARGLTLGVAAGIMPIMPLQLVTIMVLAFILRANSIAAILGGFMISNPFTIVPQYYLAWRIGKFIYPVDLSWNRVHEVVEFVVFGGGSFGERLGAIGQLGFESIAVLLLGGMIMAIPLVLIAYPLSLRLFIAVRDKRRKKHVLS